MSTDENQASTWRELITSALEEKDETWKDVEYCTLTEEQLDKEFDSGYGCSLGTPFTMWTKNRVYFPAVYDENEWVASVPRNPNGSDSEETCHVGGH